MQYLLIYPIALFLLWKVIIFLIIFGQVSKTAMQYEKYESKENEEFPGHLKQLFKHPVLELKKLGFKGCCCLQIEEMFSLDQPKQWGVLLYNQEFKTYAIVKIRRAAEPFYWFDIQFFSFFKDQTLLMTINGEAHGIVGEIPNTTVEDPYTDRTEVHWQDHRDKLEQLVGSKQPCNLASKSFLKAIEIQFKLYLDTLAKSGKILPIEKTKLFKLSFLTAIKTAIKVMSGNSKVNKINKQRQKIARKDTSIAVDLPVEIEVENFLWMQQMEKGRVKPKIAGPILVGSLVLFAISFIPLFNSTGFFDLQGLLIIIGVIFLHEAGHFLAMKCFGYQDKSMFFIPFFGAAATGHKEEATLTEKVWVLLAGPLPGLVMGIGLAIAIYGKSEFPEWLTAASWMLIGINLFNLLPIYPFDGGKIADLLLFSRYPYTDVMFKLFAVVVMVLLGMGFPMLLLMALGVGMTIPLGFRSAELDVKLRKELPQLSSLDKDSRLHLIYQKIKQFGYGKQPFYQRYQLAQNLLQRHQEARSKWTTRVLLAGLYCASLLGSLAGTFQAINPQWTRYITAITNPEKFQETVIKERIESANQALQENPSDVSAYLKRARANLMLQDYEGAIADIDRAIQLDPNEAEAYSIRSRIRDHMGDEQGAKEDTLKANALMAEPMLSQANRTLQKNPSDANAYLRRARANMMLQDYEEAIADLDRAIELDPNLAQAYLFRSNIRLQMGDEQGATEDSLKAEALMAEPMLSQANRTLQKNPSDVNAYLTRARANMMLQDYEGAIADTSQAIKLKPNFAAAYRLRSLARRQLGDEEGARADEQKAQDLDSSQF